ncbi:MAG: hypothetical protein H7301_05075 [Cryobacterium sp.]|nr:hypothetical protein [Oligoflexia bacterium]
MSNGRTEFRNVTQRSDGTFSAAYPYDDFKSAGDGFKSAVDAQRAVEAVIWNRRGPSCYPDLKTPTPEQKELYEKFQIANALAEEERRRVFVAEEMTKIIPLATVKSIQADFNAGAEISELAREYRFHPDLILETLIQLEERRVGTLRRSQGPIEPKIEPTAESSTTGLVSRIKKKIVSGRR